MHILAPCPRVYDMVAPIQQCRAKGTAITATTTTTPPSNPTPTSNSPRPPHENLDAVT